MANTVIAVRSSGTAAATPSLGVIANGEIALNFADGIIYYKTSSNTLGSIRTTQPAGLTTEVQYNDAGSFGANANFTFNKTIATLNVKNINVSTNLVTSTLTATTITTGSGVGGIIAGANVIYSNIFVANSTTTSTSNSTGAIISNGGLGVKGNVYADAIYDGGVEVIAFAQAAYNQANTALSNTNLNVSGTLRMLNQGGDEGGELFLDKPVTNTSLSAGITIDIFQNKLRFFETGGSIRGVFIDIANGASAGVGTDLLNPTATPDTVARATANAAFDKANSANVLAQSAFNSSNTKLSLSGGTISGNVTANSFIANTSVYSPVFYSPAAGSRLELSDIGLVGITVAGQTFQFGGSGIESNQGMFGGSYGGNRLSLNNETNLISNRYDTVKIQTGTDGTTVNDFIFANNTFSTPGKINVASRVDFTGAGYAQPSFTTRSAGQKITLYSAITGSLVDYSIGVDGGALWTTVPAATTDYNFRWYGGETQVASLSGTGLFTTVSANITSTTASTSNTTGALKVAGGIGVKGNVSANGIIFDDGTRQTTAATGGATVGDILALAIALG
jgi:hypothetical protein